MRLVASQEVCVNNLGGLNKMLGVWEVMLFAVVMCGIGFINGWNWKKEQTIRRLKGEISELKSTLDSPYNLLNAETIQKISCLELAIKVLEKEK